MYGYVWLSFLRSDPLAICTLSESKYDGMFILGVCGVVSYPVLGLACVAYVVQQYPYILNTGQAFFHDVKIPLLICTLRSGALLLRRPGVVARAFDFLHAIIFSNHALRQIMYGKLCISMYIYRALAANCVKRPCIGAVVLTQTL